jgi:hypothetical protein
VHAACLPEESRLKVINGLYRSRAELTAIAPAARHGEGRIAYAQDILPPLERLLYRPLL